VVVRKNWPFRHLARHIQGTVPLTRPYLLLMTNRK